MKPFKTPTVVEEQVRKLYPRLAVTLQPPCTRLIIEDSTGDAVVDLPVGVNDIYRLLDVLRQEEFLDEWAESRTWMPTWWED